MGGDRDGDWDGDSDGNWDHEVHDVQRGALCRTVDVLFWTDTGKETHVSGVSVSSVPLYRSFVLDDGEGSRRCVEVDHVARPAWGAGHCRAVDVLDSESVIS